jgi:hypothetical protein
MYAVLDTAPPLVLKLPCELVTEQNLAQRSLGDSTALGA